MDYVCQARDLRHGRCSVRLVNALVCYVDESWRFHHGTWAGSTCRGAVRGDSCGFAGPSAARDLVHDTGVAAGHRRVGGRRLAVLTRHVFQNGGGCA